MIAYYLIRLTFWLRKQRGQKVRLVPVDHAPIVQQHDETTMLVDYAWSNIDTYKERE